MSNLFLNLMTLKRKEKKGAWMHFAKFLFAKIIVKYEEKKLFFNKKNKTKHTLSQKKNSNILSIY